MWNTRGEQSTLHNILFVTLFEKLVSLHPLHEYCGTGTSGEQSTLHNILVANTVLRISWSRVHKIKKPKYFQTKNFVTSAFHW